MPSAKQHVHLFPRYCTQENISRRLQLITYSQTHFATYHILHFITPRWKQHYATEKCIFSHRQDNHLLRRCLRSFFLGFLFYIRNGYPVARENGGTGNPNHAKSHTCCTFIAPQAVLHLQLLRHKILSRLALQAKYRHFKNAIVVVRHDNKK